MTRPRLVAYWVTTGLIALVMISGGFTHVFRVQSSVESLVHLGYPLHFVTLLGIWKILGGLALLAPGIPRVKEWAYAGIAFDLSGAAVAWAAVGAGDSGATAGHVLTPLVILAIAVASWALRPASRKL